MQPKDIMEKNKKQNLIALSLVGAIGYYLYSKMAKFNFGHDFVDVTRVADDKTRDELSWRPEEVADEVIAEEPVLEELFDAPAAEEVVEEIFEEPVEEVSEEAVEEIVEEFVEEPVDEVVEEIVDDTAHELVDEVVEEVFEEEHEVVDEEVVSKMCDACGASNVAYAEVCEFCGTKFEVEEIVDEIVEEPADVVDEFVEEPVAETEETEENVFDAIVPSLNLDDINIDLPGETMLPDIQTNDLFDEPAEEVVEEVVEEEHDDEEAEVEDLFAAVNEQEEPKLMDNVEPLHKVDQKDEFAKKEYKSILDFFNTMDEK